jgi:hypothetical protein
MCLLLIWEGSSSLWAMMGLVYFKVLGLVFDHSNKGNSD